MLKHNILLTFRSFKRFKSSFFINLIGLTAGLACTLLIYLWVMDELKVDQFHEKDARLFRVMEHQQYADHIMTTTSTPGLLAEALKEDFPEIEYAATTTWEDPYTLSIGEHSIKADGYHVGSDYFNIFSYGLVQGDPSQVLADKKNIVISKSLAKQLFNTDEDVIGKVVEYQHAKEFVVSGVFEGTPENSTAKFDFVLSYEDYKDDNSWVKNWGSNGPSTFVVLREDADPADVSNKIAEYVKGKNEESNVTLFLKKYSERYLYGSYENGKQAGGRIEYVQLFSLVAIFILVIACINFMNLSTARASRRMKEVGIKKAVGAGKGGLIVQYLTESVCITFFSLLLALGIIWTFLPQFNEITDKHIELVFDLKFLASVMGVLVFTGLLAGSYPALYMSGFNTIRILKGEMRGSLGELWARRGLVVFQFAMSVLLIVSVMVIYEQIQYVQNKNLGYDNDNVVMFEIEGRVEKNLETFLTELRKIPGVVNASSIGHSLIGRNNNTSGLKWEGKNEEDRILFENMRVDYGLIETMGMEIKEGRSFSKEFSADTSKVMFNETAIEIMGLDDPIGQVVRLWDEYDLEIIGVVKDFHFQSLHETVKPAFFIINPENTWRVMTRIEAGKEKETLDAIDEFYKAFNPGFIFDYSFLNVEFEKQYAAEQRVATLSQYFAGFAVLISCLGLFGLAAFTAERRIKEIGIRKALGSSSTNIVILLSADFTKLVLLAIVVALPLSYMLMSMWLERFAFRIDLSYWLFAFAGLVSILIAWLAVGSQAVRAANVNPAKCLRSE
ncbi:ABC transporter permease [Fulvivirga lutimaris]|uniref:ABC transporter permease n=1 Tax=Fulvivirga lutimaris TaxID=1819566 RepID=UPI0012BCC3C3|nr:ABC transporter permease [Fulvivirga lutimaris]MTI39526.1 ABC transporter permease [Fulvivirga lutimaris]